MNTKTKKIILFVISLVMVLSFTSTTVLAAVSFPDIQPTAPGDGNSLLKLANNVLGILQFGGFVLGAIILAVLGIKYMAGSLEEKAEYKKTMIPYIVGAVLIIAAPTLAKGIFGLVENLGK